MIKYLIFFAAFCALGPVNTYSQGHMTVMSENRIWKRSQIVPVPSFVNGVSKFYFDASDGWMMINEPQGDIVELLSKNDGWTPMTKQLTNKGVRVPNYNSRLFRRTFSFPESFKGNRIIIRFEGVAHAAKLYVNGHFVRDHWGSFSAWTADITDFVKDGKAIVGIYTDERRNGLAAFTNGCAFEPLYISGIQYGVSYYATPKNYIVRVNPDIFFDNEYKNARLRIYMHIAQNPDAKEDKIKLEIKSPDGKILKMQPSTFIVPANGGDFFIESTVVNPVKWDAEHPELCTMDVSLYSKGKKMETVSRKIGFRQVELRGSNLFVNGQEVKFRGIWGGNDAKQLRDLNVNHVRKNWPTQGFLDSCDRFGVYVLDEIPTTFTRGNTANDPESAKQWLEIMADMLERDYSHPSVVMWSHGNESNPGTTTLQVHKFIKAEDPQRPDMFSWAQDVPVTQELPYDIYSFHYPDVMKGAGQLAEPQTAVFNSESQIIKRVPKFIGPVIADEFAHVSVGNAAINDPNIRNFWGESIKLFWDYMYNTNGSLGGNQFGVYMGLENKVNAPEEWLMRKAYSPVHIENEFLDQTKDGNLSFRVQNRFSHTNLNEIKLQWKSGTKSGSIMCPSIGPAKYGVITLPVKQIKKGDLVEMVFLRKDGFQFDEFALYVIADPFVMPAFCGKAPALNENESSVIITGDKFKIEINKKTGQILSGDYNGKTIITGGPQLNINGTNDPLPEWSCTKVSSAIKNNLAVVVIEGKYASCKAVFTLQIDNNGMIDTQYAISDFKFELLPLHEVPWNQQYYGGLKEVGVKYELSADIDRLSWDRKALWSVYPDNHIGTAKGTALKVVPENPNDWGTFTSDHGTYMTFGTRKESFNNNFRGMKEYIRTATLFASTKNCGLQVFSPMTDAVRLDQSQNGEGKIELRINNQWNYPELGLGNYMKRPIYVFENSLNGVVRMRFTDQR